MTGSPAAGLVRAWVDLYTRGLPADLRAARRDEVADDLWCEQEEATERGRSVGVDMALRLLFGMPADIGWRLTFRGTPRPGLERSLTMNTRTLGALAILGGLAWTILIVLFVPLSHGVWEGSIGVWGVIGTLVGAFAFSASTIGLAWRFQDHIGPLGAIGAGVTLVGTLVALGGPVVLFLIGLTMVTVALARIGVTSWLVSVAHLAATIGAVGLWLWQPSMDLVGTRVLYAGVLAPFLLAWTAMGASLFRGLPQVTATSG